MYEYPFGNGQQLNLDWFLTEWKNLLAAWEAEKNGIEGALQAEIDRAEAALADVFAARDAAAQSATAAGNSADAAAQSASDASGYLATVRADANTASDAARNAAQSESNAAESAQTALASKNAAGQSERNAAQSEANADASKRAAAQSASDADASKSAAAQSAADADASKSAAAQSAEDASDAAASVEASAEQIATNANNIDALNESMLKTFPLFPFMLYDINAINAESSLHGRLFKIVRNHAKVTYESSNTTGRWYTFFSNKIDFNTSDNNLYNAISFNHGAIIKTIPHLARTLVTLKLSFNSETVLNFGSYTNIAFLIVFDKNGENKRRINMLPKPTEDVTSYTVSDSRIISDIGGFAVAVFSPRSDINIEADFSLTPYPNAETSALALALSN